MRMTRLKQEKLVDLICINSDSKFVAPKQYKLNYSIYSSHPTDPAVAALEQNKAFQKINYLIDDVIAGSIVYDFKNKELIDKFFADYDNNFLTLPVVSEVLLIEALHCKFNALCGDCTHVDSIEIIDTFSGLSYMFLQEEDDYHLPSQTEFVGELPFFETPWWNRYDTTTFDNCATDQESFDEWKENFATDEFDRMTVIVLQEIDEFMEQSMNEDSKGELVLLDEFKEKLKEKEKWKPRLV